MMKARTPKYTKGGSIDLLLTLETLDESGAVISSIEIPFTASKDDVEPRGRDLYERAIAGEFGPIQAAPVTPLSEFKAGAVASVKAEAGRMILARYPQHAQANMTARAVELLQEGIKAGPEHDAIAAAWAWVKTVRSESSRLETAIKAAALAEDVTAALATAAWKQAFLDAEDRYGIPRYLLARLGWQESRYNPQAVSSAGAQGLMQFMPATAREMGIDPFNPEQAIDGAARYLVKQYRRFGTWELALKAYNWGGGNVSKWLKAGKIGEPNETRNYSAQIMAGYTAATGKVIV